MTTTHSAVNWTAGDDWQINATLLDELGNPFDLATAEILWALISPSFQRVLDKDDVHIVVTDAVNGKCSIHIPAAKTSPLLAGRYSDVLRIISGGITSTLSYGQITVAADPWIADEVTARETQPYYKLQRVA